MDNCWLGSRTDEDKIKKKRSATPIFYLAAQKSKPRLTTMDFHNTKNKFKFYVFSESFMQYGLGSSVGLSTN